MPNDRVNLMFRAFSDSTRLRILHLLWSGQMCVGDLVEVMRIPQPKASRHLAYLRRARLVTARKDGLWIHYSLAPTRGAFHSNLLQCLKSGFQDVPELKADNRRAAAVRKAGGCCPR